MELLGDEDQPEPFDATSFEPFQQAVNELLLMLAHFIDGLARIEAEDKIRAHEEAKRRKTMTKAEIKSEDRARAIRAKAALKLLRAGRNATRSR